MCECEFFHVKTVEMSPQIVICINVELFMLYIIFILISRIYRSICKGMLSPTFFFIFNSNVFSYRAFIIMHANFKVFTEQNKRFDLPIPLTGTEFVDNSTSRSCTGSI